MPGVELPGRKSMCNARSRSSAGCGFLDTMSPNRPRGHSLQGTRGSPDGQEERWAGWCLSWEWRPAQTGNMMWYRIAAELVLVVHLLFIGFVVGGAFLAWRWPRVIWVHLPAMVYGALVEFVGFTCPLTPLQNYLRRRGGELGYSGGFMFSYPLPVIYPPGLTRGIQIGLGLFVVLVAAVGYGGYLRRQGGGRAWPIG